MLTTDNFQNEVATQSQNSYQLDRSEVTIVVPTLNEEQSIGLVLDKLQLEGFGKILVVDGNSIDDTINRAKNYNVDIVQQKGKGKAGAIKTAIELINTPYFVLIDADSTYNPNEIDRLLEKAPFYNQVVGARQNRDNIPKLNQFGNDMINVLFNIFFGTTLKDVCSGMYTLNTNFAKKMKLLSEGFDIEVEIAAHCSNSINEVPISYNKRIGMQKLNSFRDGFKIIISILNLGRKYNPIVFYSFIISGLTTVSGLALIVLLSVPSLNALISNFANILGFILINVGVQFFVLGMITSQVKRMIKSNKSNSSS